MDRATFVHYAVPLCLIVCMFATAQCLGVARIRWRAGCHISAVNVLISIIALWLNFGVIVFLANTK